MDAGPQATTEELVRQARARDQGAFALLIRRYERTALAVALAGVGDGSTAGDVVQDAFVRAWEKLDRLVEPAHFGPWLVNIVRNRAADHRRQRRWMESLRPEMAGAPADESDPAAEAGLQEERRRLQLALASLDDLTRSAVVLRYYEQLPSKEIGQLLNLSPAAVDMRLMRAREELRRRLGEGELATC